MCEDSSEEERLGLFALLECHRDIFVLVTLMEEDHKPLTAFTLGPLGFWEFNKLRLVW